MIDLNNKVKLSELKNNLVEPFDLFICSASFEERCMSIAKNIDLSKFAHTMLIHSNKKFSHIQKNKELLENILGDNVIKVPTKYGDPILTADAMNENVINYINKNELESILLDITTFTRESLLILLRMLVLFCENVNVTYVYANASAYNQDNIRDKKWLSKGIDSIRSVLGYPGEILPNRKTHLIVIVGYESERAASIINTMEPSSLSLVFGLSGSATTDKDKDANEHYKKLVRQMTISNSNITEFEVSCNDQLKTMDTLQEIISENSDKNIVIASLNNKITTLATAFVAMKNQKVQLCYAPALVYNYQDYSVPGDYCYIVNMPTV